MTLLWDEVEVAIIDFGFVPKPKFTITTSDFAASLTLTEADRS